MKKSFTPMALAFAREEEDLVDKLGHDEVAERAGPGDSEALVPVIGAKCSWCGW
ncbi:hypothetical protein DACRYDRAFT_22377 [Dacryopinax primogenitus]|uniref:Uncharacterized protein n=1 Tax=Dacryopinax primogenitus (strain DJM 731) TaxID=1858805 RepID=M5G7T7_DACPD|nr:uncharacterized protein DACRYDRAFT_22377 [Dacryopinax primogenitus]EJU01947.1 hypothetical protein DACRYDRAFT_22377 [Dacryopinax primogenitus]